MATYDDYYKTLNTGVVRNLPKIPVTSSVADRVGFHYKNPYSYNLPVNIPNSAPIKRERSAIDRFFDVLSIGNYAVSGGMYNATDGDKETSVLRGIIDGVKAGNPFGQGYEKGEKITSDVLGNLGWNPKSLPGKIARGTVGFVGDVVLDPTTYLTGGIGAVVKGTGKKVGKETVEKYTRDMAEKELKRLSTNPKYKPTTDEVTDLTRRMNKLKGIAQSDGSLEFGTKHVPFREKLKIPLVNKQLMSDEKLREFGDKTIAPYFNQLLDVMKHSKITKNLNPSHDLQMVMKKNPGAVSKFLRFFDVTNKSNMSKKTRDEMVQTWVKDNLDLDEETLKYLVDVLEKPNKHIVTSISKIPLSETSDGKTIVGELERESKKLEKSVKEDKRVIKDNERRIDKGLEIDEYDDIEEIIKAKIPREEISIIRVPIQRTTKNVDRVLKFLESNKKASKYVPTNVQNKVPDINTLEDGVKSVDTPIRASKEKLTKVEAFKSDKKAKDVRKREIAKMVDGREYYIPYNSTLLSDGRYINNETGEIYGGNKNIKKDNKVVDYYDTSSSKRSKDVIPANLKVHDSVKDKKGFNLRWHINDLKKLSNQDKLSWIKSTIKDTPILRDDFEGFIFNDKMSKSKLDEFIRLYYNGTVSEVLEYKHKMHKNYTKILEYANDELKNTEFSSYRQLIKKGEETKKSVSELQKKYGEAKKIYKEKTKPIYGKIDELEKSDYKNKKMLIGKQLKKLNLLKADYQKVEKELNDAQNKLSRVNELRAKRMQKVEELTNNPELLIGYMGKKSADAGWRKKILSEDVDGVRSDKYIDEVETVRYSKNAKSYAGNTDVKGADKPKIIEPLNRIESTEDLKEVFKNKQIQENLDKKVSKKVVKISYDDKAIIRYEKELKSASAKLSDLEKQLVDLRAKYKVKLKSGKQLSNHEARVHENYKELIKDQEKIVKKIEGKLDKARTNPINKLDEPVGDVEKLLAPEQEEKIDYLVALRDDDLMRNQILKRTKWKKLNTTWEELLKDTSKAGEIKRAEINKDLANQKRRSKEKYEKILELKKQKKNARKPVEKVETPIEVKTPAERLKYKLDKVKSLPKTKTVTKVETKYYEIERTLNTRILNQERSNKIKSTIKMLNDDIYRRKDNINKSMERLQEVRNALATEDALEKLARGKYGDKIIDNVLKDNEKIIKTVFDDDLKLDDKVRDIVQILRKKFDEMGEKEIDLGILDNNKMMEQYVYHMLNPDFVKTKKNDKQFITDMFGFGQKDFNPHNLKRKFVKGYKFAPNQKAYGDITNVLINNGVSKTDIRDFNKVIQDIFGEKKRKYNDVTDVIKALKVDTTISNQIMNIINASPVLKDGTVAEINQVFKEYYNFKDDFFVHNIADVFLARALKHNQIMYDKKLTNNIMKTFGKRIKSLDDIDEGGSAVINIAHLRDYVKKAMKDHNMSEDRVFTVLGLSPNVLNTYGTPLIKLSKEEFKTVSLVKDVPIYSLDNIVVDKANKAGIMQSKGDEVALIKMYDKLLNLWKINVTAVIPGFHARNKISNVFNNYLAIGADAYSISMQKKTFNAIRSVMKKEEIQGEIITNLGKKISLADVWKLADEHGVIDAGIFSKEMKGDGTGLFGTKTSKYDPTNLQDFVPYRVGRKAGNFVENQDRLLHFASALKQGMTPMEASESVEKFLFNYSDLTDFEAGTMRRILPFYTWLRKNVPLQLENMLNQSHKYKPIAKATNAIEGEVDEEDKVDKRYLADFAQDWVQMPGKVTNPDGREEPVFWNPNLPYGDMNRLTPKALLSMTSPLIKIPTELAINKNMFFESKINKGYNEKMPGYVDPVGNLKGKPGTMSPRIKYLLDQIASVKVAGEFLEKRGADLGVHALNTLGGIKTASYDYEKYKAEMIEEYYSKVKKGVKTKDEEHVVQLYTPPSSNQVKTYVAGSEVLKKEIKKDGVKNPDVRWTLLQTNLADAKNSADEKSKSRFIESKVVRVIDGDTIDIELKNYKGENTGVRMLLIDTPETVSPNKPVMPFGKEASDYAKKILTGKDVKLYYDTLNMEYDIYGRLLAYVHVGDLDYNKSVLKEGLAKVSYVSDDLKRTEEYREVQKKAYQDKKGIWSIKGYANPNKDEEYNTKTEAINDYLKQQKKKK